jgi:hypothetical protein
MIRDCFMVRAESELGALIANDGPVTSAEQRERGMGYFRIRNFNVAK